MMKDKLYIFFLGLSFFLCACNGTPTVVNMLDESVLSEAKHLKLDTIDLKGIDIPLAYQFYVYKDSILIVQNRSRDGQSLIELYDLGSKKLINKLLRFGRGHNEVLKCTSFVADGKLIVYDFQLNNLFNINIDSVLSNKQYIPKAENVSGGIASPTYLDNQPIMDNLCVFDDDNLNIHQKGRRLIFCKDNKVNQGQNYKFNTLNVNSGSLVIASPDHKKVMYASGHFPVMELYDNNLELLKAISGPNEFAVKYYIDDDNNELIFDGSIPYTYGNYYCTSQEVGLLYYGTLVDVAKDELVNHNGWLLVFDWMGNLKKNYVLGVHVRTISNSTKWANTYYCCILGKNKELYLCKAHE